MSTKIFIDGEAGTTGLQIRDRLHGRDDIELLKISEQHRKDLEARKSMINSADIAILCLPDDAARDAVSLIENDSTAVIDASSAHRVDPNWVYGFAEMTPSQAVSIAKSKRVSNPGCYPQGFIALIRPLVDEGLISKDSKLSVNAVSGFSGGGRKMIEDYMKSDSENPPFLPYGLNFEHKHLPEMTLYSGLTNLPLFVPAVGNFSQGMIVMVPIHYSMMNGKASGESLYQVLMNRYTGKGFVEVAPMVTASKLENLSPESLNGTNLMRLHVFENEEKNQLLLVAVYDNLGKGASGSAVQNLNLLLNCNESESLIAEAA